MNEQNKDDMKYCESKHIKNQTRKKVRRIVEKRVCQGYWKQAGSKYSDNHSRYRTRHHVSNHLKNIYGEVPCGFRYAC